MRSSLATTIDFRLAGVEDAECDCATLQRRDAARPFRVDGPRERHAPLDVAQLHGTSSFGSQSRGAVRLVRHRAAARTTIGSHPGGARRRPRNLRGAPAASAATRRYRRLAVVPAAENKLSPVLAEPGHARTQNVNQVRAEGRPGAVANRCKGSTSQLLTPMPAANCRSHGRRGLSHGPVRLPPGSERSRSGAVPAPR